MEGGRGMGGQQQIARGTVEVEVGPGCSVATRMESSYPLKLMHPRKVNIQRQGGALPREEAPASQRPGVVDAGGAVDGASEQGAVAARQAEGGAAVVYVVTYGGGIVGGDAIHLSCTLHRNAAAVLTTQSSTKVFKCPPPPHSASCQTLRACVAEGALLAVLPDPVTCFAGARYSQRQSFLLAPGASLVLVDWLTCGRRALGEAWALASYESSNRVFWGERLVALEQLHLSSQNLLGVPLERQLEGVHALGLLLLAGPRTCGLQRAVQRAVEQALSQQLTSGRGHGRGRDHAPGTPWAPTATPSPPEQAPWVSCSPVDMPGNETSALLVRFTAQSTESVYRFLREQLAPLATPLGWAPYANLGS